MNETSKKTLICVVDDDHAVRTMMVRKLEDSGYATVQAANGIEAVAMLRTVKADLAIVDIIMPDQEGLATIVEIKREWPNIRILAISGGGTGPARQYLTFATEMGADATLTKPFREPDFLERIRRLAAQ